LEQRLRSVAPERLQDVIASLESYEDEFRPQHVVPAVAVLLNLLPDLPDRARGMFDLHPRFSVGGVTLRLLRCLKTPSEVETAVRQILPTVTSLSSKLDLLVQIGHVPDAGFKLVPEPVAAELEREWRGEVRAASVSQLVREKELLRILVQAKITSLVGEDNLIIDGSPDMTLAILRAAHSEAKRQTLGRRAVRRIPYLNWEALIRIYGDEAMVRGRIEALKTTQPEGSDDLLGLADKYLSGWRPSRND
jgi:hypothetical protein